jgi:hypothetical protein
MGNCVNISTVPFRSGHLREGSPPASWKASTWSANQPALAFSKTTIFTQNNQIKNPFNPGLSSRLNGFG